MHKVCPPSPALRLPALRSATILFAFVAALFGMVPSGQAQNITNVLAFAKASEVAMEGETVNLMIVRKEGLRGRILVDVQLLTNGPGASAISGWTANKTVELLDYQLSALLPVKVGDDSKADGVGTTTNSPAAANFKLVNPRVAPNEDPFYTPTLATGGGDAMALNINNNDNPYEFTFSKVNYVLPEGQTSGGRNDAIKVVLAKIPSDAGATGVSVDYEIKAISPTDAAAGALVATGLSADDTNTNRDFTLAKGTLTFADDQSSAEISVTVPNNDLVEFPKEFEIELSGAKGSAAANNTNTVTYKVSNQKFARVRIPFDNSDTVGLPSGRLDLAFNEENTSPNFETNPGANGPVNVALIDSSDRTYIGGSFTTVNSEGRSGIARLDAKGKLDPNFSLDGVGGGAVNALSLYPLTSPNFGKVMIGGAFSVVNGEQRNGVARLLANGSLDSSFNIGAGAAGGVYAMAGELGDSVIIGGDFSSFNNVIRGGIARLLSAGDLDLTSFQNIAFDGTVFSVLVEPDLLPDLFITNSVLVITNQGSPTNITVGTTMSSISGVLTLNYNSFEDADRLSVAVNGTPFYSANLKSKFTVTTNDTGIVETNYLTETLVIPLINVIPNQPNNVSITVITDTNTATVRVDGKIVQDPTTRSIYAAGDFKHVNKLNAPGIVRFTSAGVVDTAFLANIGTGADGPVYALALQSGYRIVLGGSFRNFNNVRAGGIARISELGVPDIDQFVTGRGAGGSILTLTVATKDPLKDYIYAGGDFETFNGTRRQLFARLHPEGTVDTLFMDSTFNQYAGFPNLNGLAGSGPEGYLATAAVNSANDVVVGGLFSQVGSTEDRGRKHLRSNFARLVGTGVGATNGPGNIQFTINKSGVNENGGSKTISVTRMNQSTFGDVNVFARTSDGSAVAGQDYTALTNSSVAIVTISTNSQNKSVDASFTVKITDDTVIEGDEDFFVDILGVQGILNVNGEIIRPDAAFGAISREQVVIHENDIETPKIGFAKAEYDVDEDDGVATIEVYRTGNASLRVQATYTATSFVGTNGPSATPGVDFVETTDTLVFAPGQTNRFFTVTIKDDELTELDEIIGLKLSRPAGGAVLDTNATTARLNLIDNDLPSGKIDFRLSNYTVTEGQPYIELELRRSGGNVGLISVDYTTVDGSALAGSDYVAVSNHLTWNDKDISIKTVRIPILNDEIVETNKAFTVQLINPSAPGIVGNLHSNAVVTLIDNDFYGVLGFGTPDFYADENGVAARITVVRSNGRAGTVAVNYATSSGGATPGADYTDVSGTLVFAPGETLKTFVVPILNDTLIETNEIVNLTLSNAVNGTLGALKTAHLVIVDDEAFDVPAGDVEKDFAVGDGANGRVTAIALQNDGPTNTTRRIVLAGEFNEVNRTPRQRVARLLDDGSLDTNYANGVTIDGPIRSVLATADGKLVIGGEFSTVDGVAANRIARLGITGHLDTLFAVGAGANGPVLGLAPVRDGSTNSQRIVVAGAFSSINSVFRARIAILGNDGKVDLTFDPNLGPDGDITAVAAQPDGKIVIAGNFALYNGVPRSRIARINLDGSLDQTFDAGTGISPGAINSLVIEADDKILVGGDFAAAGGLEHKGIARFNPDGSIDTSFNTGPGADGPVYSIALQPDGGIVVAGGFVNFNGMPRPGITRLLPNGSNDLNINFGSGANAPIFALASQYDRKLVIGGDFTIVNGFPRNHFARIFGGSVAGSGRVEFFQPEYTVAEAAGFVTLTVQRFGGLETAAAVQYGTSPDTTEGSLPAIPGIDYSDVSGTLDFAAGESVKQIVVPILDDNLAEDVKSVLVSLTSATGAVIGRQPVAHIRITSDDTVFSFSQSAYSVSEAAERAVIVINRLGDLTFQSSVTVTVAPGTATAGLDFTASTTQLIFTPGESAKVVLIPIIDDTIGEGPETVLLSMVVNGPRSYPGVASAVLTIDDNDFAPGLFTFDAGALAVPESAGLVTLNVRRVSGMQGAVTVDYRTIYGTAGSNDVVATNGTLSFKEGETNKTISIMVLQDKAVEAPETVTLQLFNPTGNSGLGPNSNLILTITDDDLGPGSLDTTFNPSGADGQVNSIALQPDGSVVLGGNFSNVNGLFAPHVARLDTNGVSDPNFSVGSGPNGNVNSVTLTPDGSRITIGGDFRIVNGSDRLFVARFLPSGALDASMSQSAGLNGPVLVVSGQPDTKVLIGGQFTTPTVRAGRINPSGSLDVSLNLGSVDGDVLDAQYQVWADPISHVGHTNVLIVGNFHNVGDIPRGRIARLLPDGRVDVAFNTTIGANALVRRVVPLPDGKVVIGGDFTLVNNTAASFLARLNPDGSVDPTFGEGAPNGAVYGIARQNDGRLVVGGDFSLAGGKPRDHVVRLTPDGKLDPSFDPALSINDTVRDVEVQPDGKIVIAGSFTLVNGVPRGGVARLNGLEEADATFQIITASIKASDLRITFESQPGATYTLFGTSDLTPPVMWAPVNTGIVASDVTTQTSVLIPQGTAGYQFYKVQRTSP